MFVELTKNRRSVKMYTPHAVEMEKIDAIIEAALRVPSGKALRPWEFIVVTDSVLIEKLSIAKPTGAEFVKETPLVIVVCAYPSKSHLWIEDCAIAAVTMQYAAVSLGLASRWAHMRGNQFSETQSTRDYIAELLALPDGLEVECLIAVGYPAENPPPYKKEDLNFSKVSYNRFGNGR
jgi:nitroreductase